MVDHGSLNMQLSEHEYWHGTSAGAAVCIACEGFQIRPAFAPYAKGGLFREAIYLGKSLEVVEPYGVYIVRCILSQGTRILRLDGEYDEKCIAYLRREFGKDILTAPFGAALPANKHLTRKELISLLNFFFLKFRMPGGGWNSWLRNMTWVRDQLRRHKYHCLGDASDWDSGLAVINPSRVNFVALYKRRQPTRKKPEFGPLEPVDPDILASDVHQWLRHEASYAAENPEYARNIESVIKRVRENLHTLQGR